MSSSDASASGPALDALSSSNTTPPNTNSRSQPSQPGPWLAPPQKPQPLDLSVDRGEDFRVWTRRWESFSRLSRLDTADQQTQHDVFISCVSDETMKVIDNFPIPTSSRLDVKIIFQHLKIYARGQVNDTVEHHNLSKRQQQTGERFEDFLTSIRDLSKTCTFCEPCTELILRDKIVTCCFDVELRRKLLQFSSENTLTLEKAVSIARADEATNLHEQEFESSSHGHAYANRLQKGPGRVHKSGLTSGAHGKPGKHASGAPCKYCGGAPHRERTQCPAIDRTCSKCNKKGHFASVCLSTQQSSIGSTTSSNPRRQSHCPNNVASVIASAQSTSAPTVQAAISTLNGTCTTVALPDTGADICAAGITILESLGESVSNLLPPNDHPKSADGLPMKCIGRLPVTVAVGNQSISCILHILENLPNVLLSWDTTRDLALIHSEYPAQLSSDSDINSVTCPAQQSPDSGIRKVAASLLPDENVTVEDLFREFPTVFDGVLRTMPGETYTIKLRADATPVCGNTPRRVPFLQRDALKVQLNKLHEQGIIIPVTEPIPWCSPIVVVPKKNSDDVPLCVDFTQLNKFVERERYQSPTPSESVANIASAEAQCFTTFDALKGYHQCPLDEESQLLTTFITPFGRWMYVRAPFGVSSISEHYNRRMDTAFEGMQRFGKLVDESTTKTPKPMSSMYPNSCSAATTVAFPSTERNLFSAKALSLSLATRCLQAATQSTRN